MCVTFLNIDNDPNANYKLMLVNNRDEQLDRVTSAADWERGILAGRDEKNDCRGTWLCMDEGGRIGNLLSITVPFHQRKLNAPSRGVIPLSFLQSGLGPNEFCQSLSTQCEKYDAFQVLCLQRDEADNYEMCGLANQLVEKVEPIIYNDGLHGFGNCPPNKPFLKVKRGIELMEQVVEEEKSDCLSKMELINRLLNVVTDRKMCYPDEQLHKQLARSGEICKYRSALHVQYPDGIRFGTRSHTIILVDRSNHVTFYEKRMVKVPKLISNAVWAENAFHFDLS
ncbi:unnamed protein product [Enterobius vermicularis]|uniref:Transport and Golgi organization protein 2 homolog n=1 Tax=Enterobius vermicularis TaxID=51028 RepID=A0A0N4VDN3_ENTVE|nr:unnamed protein product [Enterobius vermicularis]